MTFVLPPYIQVRAWDESFFEDWALTCVFLGFPAGAILGGYLIKADIVGLKNFMMANAIILGGLCVLFITRVISKLLLQSASCSRH